ncbi:MAG: hypothetical protein AVDCRST_MAG96-3573 [uncultured Segetibacter sp.]|uniref:Uncharacterized protein n=1 Tax=uncultured Segetibacter sp. TaxID=481133 RepID=A0A6J4TT05_9BACT|nr:MAG: hypothetical protein AVDCRST_MAG96-3573 [uncultured Segetibacter sp.]
MNHAIIDASLLVAAFITAVLITRFSKKRKTGAISSFFLLFSPLIIFVNMFAHTIAVSIVNYKRYVAGTFQYNFSFYSLLLFGIVFMMVSGINISCAYKRIKGDMSQKSGILWLNGGTAILFLPLMPINPIALLPVIASVISSATLLLMKSFTATLIYDRNDKAFLGRRSEVSV